MWAHHGLNASSLFNGNMSNVFASLTITWNFSTWLSTKLSELLFRPSFTLQSYFTTPTTASSSSWHSLLLLFFFFFLSVLANTDKGLRPNKSKVWKNLSPLLTSLHGRMVNSAAANKHNHTTKRRQTIEKNRKPSTIQLKALILHFPLFLIRHSS